MMMTETNDTISMLRWGILGAGGIAKTFAKALRSSETGELLAIGSRNQEKADRFGNEFDIPRRYSSYEALLADPDVQAVYIALPNHLHALWTIRCAEARKHILCEKPLATNYAEAMTAIEAARYHDVFLMEAFMYRCHPQTARLVQLIREGAIGDVRLIQAHFSFNMQGPRDNIRQQNAAAGGGIMDVGCYCASMARLVAGAATGKPVAEPTEVEGLAHVGEGSRVDEWATAALGFPGDILANLVCGIQLSVDPALRIWGSEGHIIVPNPWFPQESSNEILIFRDGEPEPETLQVEGGAQLYAIEADTVARHLSDRQGPPPCMTWEDSLGNMRTLDRWRKKIGLVFDNETPEALATPTSGRAPAPRTDHIMQYGRVEGVDKPISRIVMGTMVYRRDELPFTCAMLDHYVELGGTCLDTARVYGTEATVGQWLNLRGIREELVLIGKGAHTPDCHPEGLTSQLAETLEHLQTDYLDLYMLHRDNPDIPVGEFVECLNEHKRAGRIRAFGGSNWSIERIEAANVYARDHNLTGFAASSPNLALAVWNEPMWPGCVTASDAVSRAWYERTRIPLFAWSSQASGLFTGRYAPQDRTNPDMREIARTWFNEANFQRLERARELARLRGVTSTQIALAYVLCQPLEVFALIGPRSIEETRTSVEALQVSLTPEELRWLNLES